MILANATLPLRPQGFRECEGLTFAALDALGPSFARCAKRKVTGSRAFGVLYEKKVQDALTRAFPTHYLPSPWFRFIDAHGPRWCQPDGMLIDPVQKQIIVIEVKASHTGEAWWKLQKLYLPVARRVFGPAFDYRALEIVRYFDPDILFPLSRLCEHIHLCPPLPHVGVHIMKPRGAQA